MKLAVLLAAALLLIGCPGNTAQNVPQAVSYGVGRPETPGTPQYVTPVPGEALRPSPLSGVSAPRFAAPHIGTAAGAIRGTARWFATGRDGVAAAGPRLRAALGSHWRGTLVGVTYRGRTVWLRVGDWCACGSGSIIDLPDEVFAKFDPNWHGPKNNSGVLAVTVHWGDRNTLPATDMAP